MSPIDQVSPSPGSLRPCDIVMKGGVTSGIVYPAAVFEISKRFTFKNVGGTSAGAIAAVLTAAAQRQRVLGSDAGFDQLRDIPDELAKDELLFRLFRPNTATKSLFNTVTSLVGRDSLPKKAVAVLRSYPMAALLGAVPGILLFLRSPRAWPDAALAALVSIAGAALAATGALASDARKRINENYFGLVTGVPDGDASATDLTTWLDARLNEIGAVSAPDTPLTFGMLWDAHASPAAGHIAERPESWDINLEMITTNLTYGRPFKYPFRTWEFFFREDEMLRFLPAYAVAWMLRHGRRPNDEREARRFPIYAEQGFHPLPEIGDLPVILATRMSLSFPVLLSAVPLWAADFSLEANQGDTVTPKLEHCWFSDGGLSSNFPVSLFDGPIPRWPTFAINLGSFSANHPEEADPTADVYMPKTNGGARLPKFNRFSDPIGFLETIVDTMQNWNDNAQMILPGYRDRIVTVKLSDSEGGLNLDMPPDVVTKLKERGAAAGTMIASRFSEASGNFPATDAPAMNWDNHRWLRLRSMMGALRTYLSELSIACDGPIAPDTSYDALIGSDAQANSYQIPPDFIEEMRDLLKAASDLGSRYSEAEALLDNLPKPAPLLQTRPDLSAP